MVGIELVEACRQPRRCRRFAAVDHAVAVLVQRLPGRRRHFLAGIGRYGRLRQHGTGRQGGQQERIAKVLRMFIVAPPVRTPLRL
jgi:hypothetical protein